MAPCVATLYHCSMLSGLCMLPIDDVAYFAATVATTVAVLFSHAAPLAADSSRRGVAVGYSILLPSQRAVVDLHLQGNAANASNCLLKA